MISPRDVARLVQSHLSNDAGRVPTAGDLEQLFETLYQASLCTEEGEPITPHIVFIDPNEPDPDPPPNIRADRWSCVAFETPLPLTVRNLVKVAKSSDERTSSLAVYSNGGTPIIWGLVDQGNSYWDFVNFEAESGFERPGLFQVSIAGVAHLVVYRGNAKIAELKRDTLLTNAYDVLRDGPVYSRLVPSIDQHIDAVASRLGSKFARATWGIALASDWVGALCRLLLRVRSYRHGGAILITPDVNLAGLNVKHSISYTRLRDALIRYGVTTIQKTNALDTINEEHVDREKDAVPVDLLMNHYIAASEAEDIRGELDGALWFIALLTRLDGLVVMTPSLEVRGFGVEITIAEQPVAVYAAEDARATANRLRALDYNHYGTRHRSMIQYCAKNEGAVGFVVSQDGDVRAVMTVGSRVVLWDNLRLQLFDFIRGRRRNR
jgi:hypothetical protein